MIRTIATACALFAAPAIACAATAADTALLTAFDAYRAGDAMKLARQGPALKGQLLEPYYDYWRLSLRLEDASAEDVQGFLAANAGSYPAERLRAEWLKVLGRRGDWQRFAAERIALTRDDLEIRCFAASARRARGEALTSEELLGFWQEPRELPAACAALVAPFVVQGTIGEAQIWQRVRRLFEAGQISAAKTALAHLPKGERPEESLLAQAASRPQSLLDRVSTAAPKRSQRELAALALLRLASSDPRAAAAALERIPDGGPDAEQRLYVWGRLGYEAARRHYPEALDWYARAQASPLSEEQLAWKVRAALRGDNWAVVRDTIEMMPTGMARGDAAWSYWNGRALAALGNRAGAQAYYLRIASQPEFYGLLAAEELGYSTAIPAVGHTPGDVDVESMRAVPGLARALELYRLGLRSEGTREWLFSIRGLDDRRLLAASELARRAEVYDRAINTADRTATLHNFQLRYPAPYRDVFASLARSQGLDEAWVLGIVRQESRFITDARSSAGAQGLMQLMPATARWVAAKIGHRDFHPRQVVEVKTNVSLGTGYMRMVLDDLRHEVLASAAYNAGPGRARRWRDAKPLEGAIYAETIPFNETRDYVKKVMANAVLYTAVLSGKPALLKERLGTIAGRTTNEKPAADIP